MNGWDILVWISGAVLILGPIIVFFLYLNEMIRRIKHDDFT